MTKTLISSPPFVGTPLPSPLSSLSRHGLHPLPNRRLASTRVRLSFQEIPPILSLDSSIDLNSVFSRTESLLYTLADAAVSLDSASGGAASTSADGATQKNGGWFGFISEAMEFVLKVIFVPFLLLLLLLFKFIFLVDNYYEFCEEVSYLIIVRKENLSRQKKKKVRKEEKKEMHLKFFKKILWKEWSKTVETPVVAEMQL